MAEPSTFPEEHVTPPAVYRRVSGMAVTSLTIVLFFAVCMLVGTIWSFRDHSPLLLPVWLQVLPVAAGALALAALYLIRHSEGTLAGARMAGWGWWLAVILALGYWAYYGATYFAVTQQADNFTRGWLTRMAQHDFAGALLDMQEPGQRLRINPKDIPNIDRAFARLAAAIARDTVPVRASEVLRTTDLGRLLSQGGPDSKITSLGVYEWVFKEGIYTVRRLYEVETTDGKWRVRVTVQGAESKSNEFPGRQWVILGTETSLRLGEGENGLTMVSLTPEGQKIGQLTQQAAAFLQDWTGKLLQGRLAEAYLETREPAERAGLRADFESKMALSMLAAPASVSLVPGATVLESLAALDTELARERYLPGYLDLFARRSLLHTEDLYVDDEAVRPLITSGMNRLLGSRQPGPRCMMATPKGVDARFPWKFDEPSGRFEMAFELRLLFPPPDASSAGLPIAAAVTATLLSDPGARTSDGNRNWRLVRLDLLSAGEAGRGAPGSRGRRALPMGGMNQAPPPVPR
jgi:hypothetical protein